MHNNDYHHQHDHHNIPHQNQVYMQQTQLNQNNAYIPQNQNVNPYQTTAYIPPNQYVGSPMIAQTQAFPVNNQNAPNHIDLHSVEQSLKTDPTTVKCPHCQFVGVTRTDTNCNCLNLCCCFCTGLIPWILFQACRGKEMNCYDSTHHCIKCGFRLGTKTAC